jgi:hypothetical protein
MGTSGRGIVKIEGEKRPFNAVKVFSATMAPERDSLGEKVTAWLRAHPHVQVTDTIVTQSSDAAFHCLAITVFFWDESGGKP